MSSQEQALRPILERCEGCGMETPHDVSIEFVVESKRERTAKHARRPYRVTECERCGERRSERVLG